MSILAIALLPLAGGAAADGLEAPVRLEADGEPIDVAGGHAAPCVVDVDGDGTLDLLVGQFLPEGPTPYGARMRLYRNVGTNATPVFREFTWVQGGGADAKVPTG